MDGNNNPWLALSTYEEKDEYRFKGRDSDTANVLTLLRQNEYVVCYAASGDGKSSLINAGVCPKIRREGMFPIKIVFTSDEYMGKDLPLKDDGVHVDFDAFILSKIEQGIASYRDDFAKRHGLGDDFTITFEKQEKYENVSVPGLWWKLRTETIQIPFGEFNYIPVLIFDQFEELFQARWKAEFFSWLEELSKDICPQRLAECFAGNSAALPGRKMFKAIFSLRYEYVGELDYWCSQKTYVPQIMQNRYFLKPLTRSQAMEVARGQNTGGEVTARIAADADLIVDSITSTSIDDNAENDEIPAIILSLVCYVLFEKWSENNTFSLDSLSLNGLIYEYYRSQLAKVGVPDEHRIVLEDVLISRQNTRLRVAVSDPRLEEINIGQYLAEGKPNIVSVHIVKIENINGEDYLSIIHDKLVDAISVYREERIRKEKEERLAAKNRAIRRRMRIMVSLLVIVMAIVGGLVYMFFEIRNQRNSALMTQSRFVTKEALELYESGDYLTALALMSEIYPHDVKHPDRPLVDEAYYALKTMTENIRIEKFYSGNATLSPDGSHVIVRYEDGLCFLRRASDGSIVASLGMGVRQILFSPAGKYVLIKYKTSNDEERVSLWNISTKEKITELGKGIESIKFSPLGNYLAVRYENGKISVIRTITGVQIAEFGSDVEFLKFSPKGRFFAIKYIDGDVILYDISSGIEVIDFGINVNFESGLKYSSNEDYIAVIYYDGRGYVWQTDGIKTFGFSEGIEIFSGFEFSPQGNSLSVKFDNGRGILCGMTGNKLVDYGDNIDIFTSFLYSPKGDYVAVKYNDGHVSLWGNDKRCINLGNKVNLFEFDPKGDYIAVKYDDGHSILLYKAKQRIDLGMGIDLFEFSPKGNYVVLKYHDGHAGILDNSKQEIVDIGNVSSVKFSPKEDYVVIGSSDANFVLRDNIKSRSINLGQGIYSFEFSADESYLLAKYKNGQNKLWNTSTFQLNANLGTGIWMSQFDPDGKNVLCLYDNAWTIYNIKQNNTESNIINMLNSKFCRNNNIILFQQSINSQAIVYDLKKRKQIMKIPIYRNIIFSEFSQNGDKLFIQFEGNILILFDLKQGTQIDINCKNIDHIISANFSIEDEKLFVQTENQLIQVNTLSGDIIANVRLPETCPTKAIYSPDNAKIIIIYDDKIIIYEANQFHIVTLLPVEHKILSAVLCRDDITIICSNGAIISYDIKHSNYGMSKLLENVPASVVFSYNGTKMCMIGYRKCFVYETKHYNITSSISCSNTDFAEFSPDANIIVTVHGNTASLWDANTGNKLMDLTHNEDITSIQFSHDGKYILTCSDRSAKIWTLPDPQVLIDTALSILNDYKLPVEDRRKYYLD